MIQIYKECVITLLHDRTFHMLLFFIMFDIVTGTALSFKDERVLSKVNKNGLTKHFIIILMIIFFAIVFILTKLENYFNVLVMFYIASYGISIIENLGGLGVPFPNWLKKRFIMLRGETDEIETVKEHR